jgi:hypothetical protein
VKSCCLRFSGDDFLASYREYKKCVKFFAVKGNEEWVVIDKIGKIIEILTDRLCMLVEEGGTYRFLHQDFRDFFAALHVLNEIDLGLSREEVATVLKEGPLSLFVRRFMGEIEEEHRCRPVIDREEGKWTFKENEDGRLFRVSERMRGCFYGSVGFGVWNVVETWKELRGELSGADLSHLDLSKVVLNGTVCSRFYKDTYLSASFDGSLLHERTIFPQGHSESIYSAVYSNDGKKILSASWDGTIKEWDLETGQCIKTLERHSPSVNSAVYSKDGKRILSASKDGTIKEWDLETGQCLNTYKGDSSMLTNEEKPTGNGKRLFFDGNKIEIVDFTTLRVHRTFIDIINLPGMFIQGCSFKDLHPDCDLSKESKNLMQQYGAQF